MTQPHRDNVTPAFGREAPAAQPLSGAAAAPPRRKRRRGLLWAALALFVAVGTGAAVWTQTAAESSSASYATATVQRADIEDSTTAIGTVQPRDYVDVGAQISGQLSSLHVDVGDAVEKEQLLAEIDATVHQARLEAGKAQLLNLRAQAADRQAQLVLARQQYNRQVRLTKERATSEQALQSAKAALASAEAQVGAIKAQIQNTESTIKADEANLGYTRIRAPMAGTVVSLTAREGQTLNANQQAPIILSIADLSVMTVEAQVSEADVGKLKVGMDVYFTTLGQPNRRWTGKLRKVLPTPEVLNNVVLYHALFDMPNPGGELLPQMTAQVFFVSAAAKDAVVVSVAALNRMPRKRPAAGTPAAADGERRSENHGRRGGTTVQVVESDGTITSRPVKVGVTNRVSAQIVEGLEPGEKVVVGTRRPGTASSRSTRQRRARL